MNHITFYLTLAACLPPTPSCAQFFDKFEVHPLLTINQEGGIVNETLWLSDKQVVDVKCYIIGVTLDEVKLEIECGDKKSNGSRRMPPTLANFLIGFEFHQGVCTCLAKTSDSKTEMVTITILVQGAPRLVNPEEKYPVLSAIEGGKVKLDVEIYAVPEVKVFNLSKNGTLLETHNQTQLLVSTKLLNATGARNTVRVEMTGLEVWHSGEYLLTLDNGIEEALEYNFQLNVARKKGFFLKDWLPQISVLLLLGSILLYVIVFNIRRSRRSQNSSANKTAELVHSNVKPLKGSVISRGPVRSQLSTIIE